MKILVSTFGQHDFDRIVFAMRQLPYERIVLMGTSDSIESVAFERIREIEEMSGHGVLGEVIPGGVFMDIVNDVSESLARHLRGDDGRRNEIVLNISGGDKLLGDAALFAAFRLGIETYHCDERVTKLPVLKGLTAQDRFTPSQVSFIKAIRSAPRHFDDIVDEISTGKRQSAERVMRELKKAGLIHTEVRTGKIIVSLSEAGAEVARAISPS